MCSATLPLQNALSFNICTCEIWQNHSTDVCGDPLRLFNLIPFSWSGIEQSCKILNISAEGDSASSLCILLKKKNLLFLWLNGICCVSVCALFLLSWAPWSGLAPSSFPFTNCLCILLRHSLGPWPFFALRWTVPALSISLHIRDTSAP